MTEFEGTNTTEERHHANTKEEDPTGFINDGMRYRDPENGVFLSRDPAGFVDGPNVYTYVRQNPWTSFDPAGLATVSVSLGDDYKFVRSDPHAKGLDTGYQPYENDFKTGFKSESESWERKIVRAQWQVDLLLWEATSAEKAQRKQEEDCLKAAVAEKLNSEKAGINATWWREEQQYASTGWLPTVVDDNRTLGKFMEFGWDNTGGSAMRLLSGEGDWGDALNFAPFGLGKIGRNLHNADDFGRLRMAAGGLGSVDEAFLKMGMTKRIEAAFGEMESAFGSAYASRTRELFDSAGLRFTNSTDVFGAFTVGTKGQAIIDLSRNVGNAKTMALTILHEVGHLRHSSKLKMTPAEYIQWNEQKAEIFATSTNLWQGRAMGMSDEDMQPFI